MQHSPGFVAIVETVLDRVTHVSIAQYQENDAWQLIDVREDHEWLLGHLPQAKHLGRGIIERDIEKRFPDKEQALLLYCGGGYRSSLAAYNLQLMGYTNVGSLTGGYSAWVQQQLPIVQD
jgi:rhodanese-related sulfurtransferase